MELKKEIVERIFMQGNSEAPVEACGYLAGKGDVVITHYPMKNKDNSSDHFSLDPAEQFAVIRKVRESSLDIIGVYHTHPVTPARPSEEDIRLAYDPSIIYVIASLIPENKNIKAFRINKGQVTPETLIIKEQ